MRRIGPLGFSAALALFAMVLAATQGVPIVTATDDDEDTVKVREHPTLGKILVDGKGKTLYLYTRDVKGETNCYEQCAVRWPPLAAEHLHAAPDIGGTLGKITRRDNIQQVTYNDIPLYYFQNDSGPGDTNGQGVGGVWFVLAPGINQIPPSQAAPAPQPSPQPAAPAPAAKPAAPAAPPAAKPAGQPAAQVPRTLPRTGSVPFDPTFAALGIALVGFGLVLWRRGR